MLRNIIITLFITLSSGSIALVVGQTTDASIKPTYIIGDVVSTSSNSILVNTKAGQVNAVLTDKTAFKRASAETLNLAAATAGVLTDISVGDKVTISALLAADGKTMNARTVYFITKADIAAKNAKESAEWNKRGIAGKVLTVNAQTGQINVEIRSMTGSTNMTVTPKSDASFLRYAPNSERFDEAKKSTLTEVKAGDMIRALGDKNADGTALAAEKVLTGAFQTVAGTVVSVDAEKNEVVIKNLQTKKDVTVVIGETSLLKKYPAEMAERMAGFQMAGQGGPRPVGQGQGAQPTAPGGQPTATRGGQTPGGPGRVVFGGRPGGVGAGSVDEMLERFPTIKATDLKVGEMIAVSSTKDGIVDRIRAIKLLAGVEPFLRLAQATGRRAGQGGVEAGFSIPGLDGIGFP